jgi:hypothetical protein
MRLNRQDQRTEIIVEHHEITTVRRPCDTVRYWCPGCGATVDMVVAEQAANLAGLTPRAVYRWLEAARVHYLEGRIGTVLICTPSLLILQTKLIATEVPGGLK